MIIRFFYALIFTCVTVAIYSQSTFPGNGPADPRPSTILFRNATIVVSPKQQLVETDLLIADGKIKRIGKKLAADDGAIEIDVSGKWVYPAFIDMYAQYGLDSYEPVKSSHSPGAGQKLYSDKKGSYYWNEAIHPETQAYELYAYNDKEATKLRSAGFGAVVSHVHDGISRGSAVFLATCDKANDLSPILAERVAQGLSLSKGRSTQSYPSSQMGSIALLRQLFYDGIAKDSPKDEKNLSVQAWRNNASLPSIFAVNNWMEILRVQKIAREFNTNFLIKSNGDEYRRIDAIKSTGMPLIIPIDFPAPAKMDDILDINTVSLEQLKHIALAPRNPGIVAENGIRFAITASGLRDIKQFREKLLMAIDHGLSQADALAALTTEPARMIGQSASIGTIEVGKWANFFLTDENYFDKKSNILDIYVQGTKYVLNTGKSESEAGEYQFRIDLQPELYTVVIGKDYKDIHLVVNDSTRYKGSVDVSDQVINFTLYGKDALEGKVWRCSGQQAGQNFHGTGQNEKGESFSWDLTYVKKPAEKNERGRRERQDSVVLMPTASVVYPFHGYGNSVIPKAERVLLKNATLWTNEAEGILTGTDILIADGKIAGIGKGLSDGSARVIDATGKHITSGIIDEHSHIAISSGVNESGQESSAEVSIADVINSDDVNIYRQLSGGVVASQLLHGSANPIGGQSAMIKLRWGALPQDMLIKGADGFIKFALGENVKQTNWGTGLKTRYPQSRMGVEQVYEDYFSRAQAYKEARKANPNMRRDLDLETIVEILDGKRFITCHSYQQGEINMLMKVAEKYKFKVNTFTHILEGYKVADKMAAHGAGASSFADWWAYKYEVVDAIPYNGKILSSQGVVTAYNSDDAEMARRLNQEAAKAVLYGGVSAEEAWKFVTLNPAKLLHLDHRMGSLRVGKDADIVVWSDEPLSIYAVAEQTYVDGVKYYDRNEDKIQRATIAREKMRLINEMAKLNSRGMRGESLRSTPERLYHCEDFHDEGGDEIIEIESHGHHGHGHGH